MTTVHTWQLPIRTASEANRNDHWTKRYKRKKEQRIAIKKAFLKKPPPEMRNYLHVILTRIAPRLLDVHDNLPVSFKTIVDKIAEELTGNYAPGHADSDKRLSWEYKQEKSKEYAIRIEIVEPE